MDTTEWFTLVWALSILLVTSLTFAIVCAALVLLPRNRKAGVSLYWRAWPEAGDRLTQAILVDDKDFIAAEYEETARLLAAICHKKYFYVAIPFRGLGRGGLFHI